VTTKHDYEMPACSRPKNGGSAFLRKSPMSATSRSRLVEWEDPSGSAARAAGMSGFEFLTAIAEGRLPHGPISDLMGMTGSEFSEGRAVMWLQLSESHCNPFGTIHGGVAATLLDGVLGCAVHATLPVGKAFTTLTLEVKYTRGLTPDSGVIRAEATVVSRGKRVMTSEGRVFDVAGRICATRTSTCLVLETAQP